MVTNLQNSVWLLGAGEGGHGLTPVGLFAYAFLVIAIIFGILTASKNGLNPRYFTNRWTQRTEQLYLFLENMALGIIGPHGKRYMPILFTFWLVIFISNLFALFMPSAPTADLSFNLGMALIAIGYVQYEGMRANGVGKHWTHFAGPKLPIALIPITMMIFVIEIISEAMKNLSLSLRLFGNIDGGHLAAESLNSLGKHIIPVGGMELSIPFGAFLLPIKLLTVVVQALIFTLLFSVYLSLVTHHDDHGDEHATAAAH
ncbi:MAG: F0F1 ATP synthase subunit A [Fimbriimonadaceae bacterium]|nr:F0F1 ATP synthase subunit A [Fimbriimonadaceae bacterium]